MVVRSYGTNAPCAGRVSSQGAPSARVVGPMGPIGTAIGTPRTRERWRGQGPSLGSVGPFSMAERGVESHRKSPSQEWYLIPGINPTFWDGIVHPIYNNI